MTHSGLPADLICEAVEGAGLPQLKLAEAEKLSTLFDLLQRWSARLNLTSIRSPGQIVRRHFLESLFCAQHVPRDTKSLLDYGSGAGFPGIPIAVCRPELAITLAESQGKKASFLREAVRTLGLEVEVFSRRVEEMDPVRIFDVVTLRAVDKMRDAVEEANQRIGSTGCLMILGSARTVLPQGAYEVLSYPLPGEDHGKLFLCRRK